MYFLSYHLLEGLQGFEGDVDTPWRLEIALEKKNHRVSHPVLVREMFPGYVISFIAMISSLVVATTFARCDPL